MNDLEDIEERIVAAEEFTSSLSKYLDKNFKIADRDGEKFSVKEWQRAYSIKIPDDITFQGLVDLAAEIADKYQRAAAYRDQGHIQITVLDQVRSTKYHTAYQLARETAKNETGKNLSAESCKVEALLATRELEDALASQKLICDFWDRTCKTLTEVRKLVELMSIALSGDAKVQRDFVIRNNG